MAAVRSKICGITRIDDALAAVEAGADAIGLVFYAQSPRAVTVQQARAIIAALPPFVSTVGLFVNASRCELGEILDAVPLDLLQFHGDETPADCEGYRRPYIKALRVKAGDDITASCQAYAGASGMLLDTYVEGVPGGMARRSIGRWCPKVCANRLSLPAACAQKTWPTPLPGFALTQWMSVAGWSRARASRTTPRFAPSCRPFAVARRGCDDVQLTAVHNTTVQSRPAPSLDGPNRSGDCSRAGALMAEDGLAPAGQAWR